MTIKLYAIKNLEPQDDVPIGSTNVQTCHISHRKEIKRNESDDHYVTINN